MAGLDKIKQNEFQMRKIMRDIRRITLKNKDHAQNVFLVFSHTQSSLPLFCSENIDRIYCDLENILPIKGRQFQPKTF